MDLNHERDFNTMVCCALNLGMTHTGIGTKRVSSEKLLNILSARFGAFGYRRFHVEILNRAYGLPFINQAKMRLVRKMKAQ